MADKRRVINISISGPTGCGKSIVAARIRHMLEECGLTVDLDDPYLTDAELRTRERPEWMSNLAGSANPVIEIRTRR
jgi:uridine kinase